MYDCMDGWIDGWMEKVRADGWMDGWMEKGRADGCMDGKGES